jgi:hypothetical protein
MNTTNRERHEYVERIIECYRRTPETTGQVRQADRRLAMDLYERGISVSTVESAIILATVRRMLRPPDYGKLAPIRSLHYFLPIIAEITENPLAPDYIHYLREKIEKHMKGGNTDTSTNDPTRLNL